MPTILKIHCDDLRLSIVEDHTLTAGGKNNIQIDFSFCDKWDGYAKTAVFYRHHTEVYHALLVNDSCLVPEEVMERSGSLYVGVFGVKDDVTRPSEVLELILEKGAITTGKNASEPTPSVYEQILSAYALVRQMVETANMALDNHLKDKNDPHGVTPEQIGAKAANTIEPIAHGGTGAHTAELAMSNLSDLHYNGDWQTAKPGISVWHYEADNTEDVRAQYNIPHGCCEILVMKRSANRGVALAFGWTMLDIRMWRSYLHDDTGSNSWGGWTDVRDAIGAAPAGYINFAGTVSSYAEFESLIDSRFNSLADNREDRLFCAISASDGAVPAGSWFVSIKREWADYGVVEIVNDSYRMERKKFGTWGAWANTSPSAFAPAELITKGELTETTILDGVIVSGGYKQTGKLVYVNMRITLNENWYTAVVPHPVDNGNALSGVTDDGTVIPCYVGTLNGSGYILVPVYSPGTTVRISGFYYAR